jgi:uncharacterized protein (TIGR02677 family)
MERIPPELFRFSVGENADTYTAILRAFAEANERLETSLSLDEVQQRLRTVGWFGALTNDDLARDLQKLRDWQLVDVIQNHAENYRTAEEYERRNLQYSLTKRGEAAFAGVQHALTVLASTGALQTAVLDAIADRLAELHKLLTDAAASDRKIFTTLTELENHLDALRTNTKQFNSELQRLLRAESADLTTFREVKTATVAYLEEFLTNLERRAQAIADGIGRLEKHGLDTLHERALTGADLPPSPGNEVRASWLALRRSRWAGLRQCGRGFPGTGPVVDPGADGARPVLSGVRARLRPPRTPDPTRSGARQFVDLLARGPTGSGITSAANRRTD